MTKFHRSSCANCWIHSGWSKSYESIKKRIFGALEEFGCQHKSLYITGHSLGGAVLHYFLYDALESNYSIKRVTAMETPRPGNKQFATALQASLSNAKVYAYRITHYQDFFVHMPPYGLADYAHA